MNYFISDTHFRLSQTEDLQRLISQWENPSLIGLLGDIGTQETIPKLFSILRQKFSCRIVFIPGNHDFYKCDFDYKSHEEIIDWLRQTCITYGIIFAYPAKLITNNKSKFLFCPCWHDGSYSVSGMPQKFLRQYYGNLNDKEFIGKDYLDLFAEQYIEFKKLLAAKPDYICTHYPIFKQHAIRAPSYTDAFFYSTKFGDLIDFKTIVISGHIHNEQQKQINSNIISYTIGADYGKLNFIKC